MTKITVKAKEDRESFFSKEDVFNFKEGETYLCEYYPDSHRCFHIVKGIPHRIYKYDVVK